VRKTLAAIVTAGVMTAACGALGSDDPLAETSDKLGDITSGILDLRVAATTEGGDVSGFELRGPFSLPEGGSLPTARLTFVNLGEPDASPTVFVATGDAAFIEIDGQAYRLPDDRVQSLRGSASAGDEGPLDGLDVAGWVHDEHVSDGPPVDGEETTRVRADIDLVTALNDLFGVADDFAGADFPVIDGDAAERIRGAVRSARLEVLTGADDGLLRDLSVDVDMGATAPRSLDDTLAALLGVAFDMRLKLERPNEDVHVSPPADALPYEELLG
jgi:hypothetical protein